MNISIDKEKCAGCGHCATVCPSFVLHKQMNEESKQWDIETKNVDMCIGCGHCVMVCKTGAISHETFANKHIRPVDKNLLPSPESVMELMRSRRSNRTITDKEIPDEWLNMIKEAAWCAPTAENSRNIQLRMITDINIIQNIENKVMNFFMNLVKPLQLRPVKALLSPFLKTLYRQAEELGMMNDLRKQGKRPATVNAKAILLITAPKDSRFGYQDSNLAYQNASLMAQALGLTQIYLGFVQTAFGMMGTKKTANILGIDKNQKVFAIMAIGIPSFSYPNCIENF